MNRNQVEKAAKEAWERMETYTPLANIITEKNVNRVLDSFRRQMVGEHHFYPSSGYGYDDSGRDKLEEVYADVFGTEAALVRQQMISGTHAIALALFGNLLPGDELLTVGLPYDTLLKVIGYNEKGMGTLKELGINFRYVDFDFENFDPQQVLRAVSNTTKIISIQRSRGYAWRKTLSVQEISQITKAIKETYPHIIVFVDNCYGEMVEDSEPSHWGADLMAGSLIKNMGAGIVPGGGYIVGKEELVERAACRLTVPGAGREMGASLVSNRCFFQALFMAPQIVKEAVLGAVFASSFLDSLGFELSPLPYEERHDIIQAIKMKDAKQLIAFCQGVQKYSPINSFAVPEPSPLPGYDSEIIMAAGTFVQGSTIELSADAPLREPYTLYMQGGLNRYHVKYALINTAYDMAEAGLL